MMIPIDPNRLRDPDEEVVRIARSDVLLTAAVVSARLADDSTEQQRLAYLDELLRATSNLGRALIGYARHALSESRGSHSTWDVAADADDVFVALAEYADLTRIVAGAYRGVLPRAGDEQAEAPNASPPRENRIGDR